MRVQRLSMWAVSAVCATATAATLLVAPPATAAPTPVAKPVVARALTVPLLHLGNTGPYVKLMQRRLLLPQTGVYGASTRTAVIALQRRHHLAVTGTTTLPTWIWSGLDYAAYVRRLAAARVASRAGGDPTVSAAARTSRAARAAVPFAVWALSPVGHRISARESNNICSVVNGAGPWYGKWQMDINFWRSYGGTAFAATPNRATCGQQDLVAYRGWIASWWSPWSPVPL